MLESLAPALAPAIVIVPLIGAAITLLLARFRALQSIMSTLTLALSVGIALALLFAVDAGKTIVVSVGGWMPPFGIVLYVDRLSAIMLVISSVVLLGVLLYSVGQGIADGDKDTPLSIFHPTYLILAAGLFDAFVAGDLFNVYVGFEMLLAASFVLLTLGGIGPRIRSGVNYVVISLVSSVFFLAAIAIIFGATGTVNIAQIAERIAGLDFNTQLMLHTVLLVGFAVKAAVWPMSFWLPESYPTAPAPITAVFAGLLTKVGIYAIIRTETVLFPGGALQVPLLVVAGMTLIVGILGALAQADIKRLLSFTLVSHIGYMVFGIAVGTAQADAAVIYYVAHHILVQTTLFLVAGLIERVGGTTSITRLGGLLASAPVIAILYFIPAMNLGGIPPLSGFLGKVSLFFSGAEEGGWLIWTLIGLGALTSLLTLYALARIWNMVFWRGAEEVADYESPLIDQLQEAEEDDGRVVTKEVPKLMIGATSVLVLATVSLTVFAGPLFDLADRASGQLDQTTYISNVFPGYTDGIKGGDD